MLVGLSGTCDCRDIAEFDYAFGFAPRGEVADRVVAEYESGCEAFGVERVEVSEGVDGKRDLFPVDFESGYGEGGIGGGGEQSHGISVFGRSEFGHFFVWRMAGGDEYDVVKIELREGFFSGKEVSVVDWIECAAHDAEAQHAPARTWDMSEFVRFVFC